MTSLTSMTAPVPRLGRRGHFPSARGAAVGQGVARGRPVARVLGRAVHRGATGAESPLGPGPPLGPAVELATVAVARPVVQFAPCLVYQVFHGVHLWHWPVRQATVLWRLSYNWRAVPGQYADIFQFIVCNVSMFLFECKYNSLW